MNHKSNALQDAYLIQTHFKLEKFEYYESLMKQVYKELELKHCMLEELQSRIEELEKENASLKQDANRYRFAKSNKSQGKSDIVIVHKTWGGDQVYLIGDKADEVIDTAM